MSRRSFPFRSIVWTMRGLRDLPLLRFVTSLAEINVKQPGINFCPTIAFTVDPPTKYSPRGELVSATCNTTLAPTSGS
jgi:hypothetical protein